MSAARNAYFVVMNSLLLLVVLVLAAHGFVVARQAMAGSDRYAKLPAVVQANYAHMTRPDVNAMLDATWTKGWAYEPWLGFREAARSTPFVNVNEFGLRANGSAPVAMASLDGAIWFFGGSTTFGYGVRDDETIPARLEAAVKRRVINFGRAYYYSGQENFLLAQYLKLGYRPAEALFLDGINEKCDIDEYQQEMQTLFAKAQKTYTWDAAEIFKPLTYELKKVLARIKGGVVQENIERSDFDCGKNGKMAPLSEVHRRNMVERRIVCDAYAVKCTTLVQPFYGVHGRHDDPGLTARSRALMREKYEQLVPGWRAANAVFVTSALDGLARHAYVDRAHYSAEANALIAQAIAASLR